MLPLRKGYGLVMGCDHPWNDYVRIVVETANFYAKEKIDIGECPWCRIEAYENAGDDE